MTRRSFIAGIPILGLAQTIRGGGALRGNALHGPIVPPGKYMFSIGQSLSKGGGSQQITPLTTTQPYTNKKWNGGVVYQNYAEEPPIEAISNFLPLIEGDHTGPAETHCSAFANQVSALARADGLGSAHDSIHATFGRDGFCYNTLNKGTAPYNDSLSSVTRAVLIAPGMAVPALICVHGECDGSSQYAPKVVQWQSDYEADIKAITGQSAGIPIFMTQVDVGEPASGSIAIYGAYSGMLGAHEHFPTKTILCNPKYIFPYENAGTHLLNTGYRWLGEYYAKAYYQHVVRGVQWQPLRPISTSTSGAVITVQFTGFVAPLVFDTTNVTQLADSNYGFTYDGGDGPTIASVAITDATNGIVQITLSAPPSGDHVYSVGYAAHGTPTGPVTGCRGCLRDSDPMVSLSGNHLYNWCVHWSKGLNWTSP